MSAPDPSAQTGNRCTPLAFNHVGELRRDIRKLAAAGYDRHASDDCSPSGLMQFVMAGPKKRSCAMKAVPTIDAHHHIWRLKDLAWLSGPQVPRIFGPYQPICRDYTIDEYRRDIAGCDVVKSIYIQTKWPAGRAYDEALWLQSIADETGCSPAQCLQSALRRSLHAMIA